MNIGIVTQPLIVNYGGLLQNFALQQVLKSLGHNPVTLDYMSGLTGFTYVYKQMRRAVSYLLGRWPEFLYPYKEGRSNREIIAFIEKYISTTHTFWGGYSSSLVDRYALDAIVVGSDQVWRPMYNRHLYDMYLDFCRSEKVLKIAYGASFATSEWEYNARQAKKCSKLLKGFRAVSVREPSGLDLLRRLGRDDGRVVADPTILLGRGGFDKILFGDESPVARRDYLGAYVLDPGEECRRALEDKKNSLGLESVMIYELGKADVGPVQWIDTIRHASFFVTDSFHGTIFCLLYHVPFVTVINETRGAARFRSLLEPLGLEKNLVHRFEDIKDVGCDVDWNNVDRFFAARRAESLAFLREYFG
ncbi:MAG: polysaccharide pyruvyl transferase family protein [Muribaculaceae bacterium]|nr:polysaccharide pyruvyl transferase family protein [Muribaculaceae bacterium]